MSYQKKLNSFLLMTPPPLVQGQAQNCAFNVSRDRVSNSKCNLIFFSLELITQKCKIEYLTIGLVTRSETFYI